MNRNWNGGGRGYVVSKRMEAKSRACTSRMVVNPLLGLTLGNVLEWFASRGRIPTEACVSALIPHSKLANRFPFCAWPAIDRLARFSNFNVVPPFYIYEIFSLASFIRVAWNFCSKALDLRNDDDKRLIKDEAKRKELEKKRTRFRNDDINRAAQWKNDSSAFFSKIRIKI